MGQFFPALHGNAVIDRSVYGVPFHNSTPLLYVNADHFKEAGLDPDKLPRTWDELIAAAKKLTKRDGDRVTRWGIMMPSNYDYGGWILQALTHVERRPLVQRGLRRRGLLRHALDARRADLLVATSSPSTRSIRPASRRAPRVSTAFLSGQASMMLLSTGSLTHVRNNAKFPYKVGVRAEERAQRGADRRRLAGHPGGRRGRAAEGRPGR